MIQRRALLAGSGIAIPDECVDNHQMSRVMDTSDQWIRERTGIVTRHFAEAGKGSSQLAGEAASAALDDARMEASELDYIVCATMTPDHYFPGAGTLVQHHLGIDPLPTLDIRQQCAGFAYGLQVVDALVRSGAAHNVLLVGSDVHTSLMPFSAPTWDLIRDENAAPLSEKELEWNTRYRHLTVLFGDGAGAMIFRAHEEDDGRGILASALYGDGAEKEILFVPGAGSSRRPWVDEAMLRSGETIPRMDGRKVFKYAVTRMPKATKEVLRECGFGLQDLDLLVMHQANLRINEAAQRMMKLPDEKIHNNIQKYGNTTSATLPICFHEAREEGRIPEQGLVAFAALGAGLHWGAVLMRL